MVTRLRTPPCSDLVRWVGVLLVAAAAAAGCRGLDTSSAAPDAGTDISLTEDAVVEEEDAQDVAEGVDWEEMLPINGVLLAARVRGDIPSLPLLLVLHGGPGFAMLDLLHTHSPELEADFLVVTYDQRGAGLSYAEDLDSGAMTLAQFVDDAHAVRQAVLDHFGRADDTDVYVLGHSMGTVIGLDLVKNHPASYASYIGVGQVVTTAQNEQGSYDFALEQAQQVGNQDAIDELECVGRPTDDFAYEGSGAPDCPADLDGFAVTNTWIGFFGGDVYGETGTEAIEAEILESPAYAGHEDKWSDGSAFSAHLFDDPAVAAWDARILHNDDTVPLFFFMGRHDYDTPAPLAAEYSAGINGPHRLVWFEESAHFPFYEESALFRERLVAVAHGELLADE